jgi:long-chain acyl-CoA synthetase
MGKARKLSWLICDLSKCDDPTSKDAYVSGFSPYHHFAFARHADDCGHDPPALSARPLPMVNDFASRPWLQSYAPDVPHEIPPASQTLVDLMTSSISEYGSKVALEFFGATTTYRELGTRIERAANGLRALGVGVGDRVALVLPNCPQHVVSFHAVLRLGAVVVEHNPLYTATEMQRQFDDHGAKVAIVWDKLAAMILGFPASVGVTTVVSVNMTKAMRASQRILLRLPLAKARASRRDLTTGRQVARTINWETVEATRPTGEAFPQVQLENIAVLQYTSGTTGAPKGAILTHENLRVNASQGEAWLPGLAKGSEVFYAVLPMFHAYGLTLCLTFAMSVGARLVLFPKFDEGLVLTAMKRTPATFLPAVPPIYERLAAAAVRESASLRGIRFAISGAMPLPVDVVATWELATGGFLVEGYGMTETSPIAACNPIGSTRRPGTVGVPFPNTEIRVVNPDDPAVDRGVDDEGELLIRGPQVFRGYWHRDEETAATLLEGGWLRTGDIVRVSADGFITVVDRIKELINTGGFKVAPSEVEAVLTDHPDILEAAVVCLPNTNGGEDVTAAVVLRPGAELDVKALQIFCREKLTPYKVPRTIVQLDELPRSMVGKVQRREVRAILERRRSG